ncbi:protein YIPF1 homolog isoform X2 [Ananas comosus]|uniref:Protein YIP n=1 Tax=Ananas comosus TaxID=4615 RepID=A0A6P5G0K1_ANACO|nr:protein YIPF1 homolog isoform X2 [Ananas comosus]
MEEGYTYTALPTSHLLGSVPAVIDGDIKGGSSSEASPANLQVFPPTNGAYQAPGSPADGNAQTATDWKGFFSISSYSPYFNVDTDVVVDRLVSSVYPMDNFYRKIDGNPDLYGPVWISTTLVFMLAALGNFATYTIQKRSDPSMSWNFDVGFVNWAALVIYGYVIVVPAALFFLLQYFGINSSLIRLWCIWGYSLFIFIPASLLLVVPVEIFRWLITILAGCASSWFIFLNLKVHTEGSSMTPLYVSAMVLQFALALFIKIFFFA